jgi:hypothetical protein
MSITPEVLILASSAFILGKKKVLATMPCGVTHAFGQKIS